MRYGNLFLSVILTASVSTLFIDSAHATTSPTGCTNPASFLCTQPNPNPAPVPLPRNNPDVVTMRKTVIYSDAEFMDWVAASNRVWAMTGGAPVQNAFMRISLCVSFMGKHCMSIGSPTVTCEGLVAFLGEKLPHNISCSNIAPQ
jgi:hypothetical protein